MWKHMSFIPARIKSNSTGFEGGEGERGMIYEETIKTTPLGRCGEHRLSRGHMDQ